MYYRIKNSLDAKALANKLYQEGKELCFVADRIVQIITVLDENYGSDRKPFDMGGYVLYFPTTDVYQREIGNILEFYHINPDGCEYQETIGEKPVNGMEWKEELFLLSSDDSLVLVYPMEAGK